MGGATDGQLRPQTAWRSFHLKTTSLNVRFYQPLKSPTKTVPEHNLVLVPVLGLIQCTVLDLVLAPSCLKNKLRLPECFSSKRHLVA